MGCGSVEAHAGAGGGVELTWEVLEDLGGLGHEGGRLGL